MNVFISNLDEHLEYFTLTQIENGVGAFLYCVHKYSNRRNYRVIQHKIPDAEFMRKKFENIPDQECVGNLLSLAGNLFGVRSVQMQTLIKCLSKSGYTTIMVSKFLPALLYNMRKSLPEFVFNQVQNDIPGLYKFGYQNVGRMPEMLN